jgi:hypothetical protein
MIDWRDGGSEAWREADVSPWRRATSRGSDSVNAGLRSEIWDVACGACFQG